MKISPNELAIVNMVKSIISITDEELATFFSYCEIKTLEKKETLSKQGELMDSVYFVEKGLLRHTTTDKKGQLHTTHFATENQFLGDYSAYITGKSAKYSVQALEETIVIIVPKTALDWMFTNVEEGEKLGRAQWDYFYLYLDERLHDMYTLTPKERYENMNTIFPNIHQRVPQHMIASYIGVSKVHLSRIKNGKA